MHVGRTNAYLQKLNLNMLPAAASAGKQFSWGDEFKPKGKWQANIWQGEFPSHNTADDGFTATSPAASYPANGYGLYDMTGNVWEWCSDWYRADYYKNLASETIADNPQGPANSYDPFEPGTAKEYKEVE